MTCVMENIKIPKTLELEQKYSISYIKQWELL